MIRRPLRTSKFLTAFLFCSAWMSCRQPLPPHGYELASAWADMATYITKNTFSNSPTFASRCFGYIGLTMYESVVHGAPDHQSLASQLNGLGSLPLPQKGISYNWMLSLNAGQAEILRSIYIQTSDENKRRIDSLEGQNKAAIEAGIHDQALIDRSIAYGKLIAQKVFEWSKTDGGHRGYLHNFDKSLRFQQKPGCWKPPLYAQSFSHYPLHPHWGQNRTFLVSDSEIVAPTCIPYDTTPGSVYYNEFRQVYEKEKSLNDAEKEAAIWWSDDPEETFTPPGHSYYLATLVVRKKHPSLITCAETFARVGMAVADAFRNCWKWKYQFFSERPNTFIPEHIDRSWHSFWPDPPFPAFPSGHAIQAAATATVLADLYGKNFEIVDSAHAGRRRDEIRNTEFVVRRFHSFWEVAEETAASRFYGGIHTPQDNNAGLQKGKEIGENINRLKWRINS